jgi:hypothetical protein
VAEHPALAAFAELVAQPEYFGARGFDPDLKVVAVGQIVGACGVRLQVFERRGRSAGSVQVASRYQVFRTVSGTSWTEITGNVSSLKKLKLNEMR